MRAVHAAQPCSCGVSSRMLAASGDDDWEWPTDNALSSPYYTSKPKVVPGEAPAPKPTPVKLPTRPARQAHAQAPAMTLISDYAWCDDGPVVSVYVTGLRGVRKDGVVCGEAQALDSTLGSLNPAARPQRSVSETRQHIPPRVV